MTQTIAQTTAKKPRRLASQPKGLAVAKEGGRNLPPQAAAIHGKRMTWEQFLKLPQVDGVHFEWVGGKAVMKPMVSYRHADIFGFLFVLFRLFVGQHKLGKVLADPFAMKLGNGTGKPGRAPDIMFVAARRMGLIGEGYLDGPADLVVEIVSPGSRKTDLVLKFEQYQAAAVSEYWIVDYKNQTITFYQLDDNGKYQKVQPGGDGFYRSREIKEFRFRPDWLWQEPLPEPADCFEIIR